MAEGKRDPTMMNILLILGALVSFVFTILTFAFGADIALYSMAVKNEVFWESEYGYTDWNATSESGTTKSTYHTDAEAIETDVLESIQDAASLVTLAGSIVTLVLLAAAFFRKDGGLINMFRSAQ
jgi:hypothetical protein